MNTYACVCGHFPKYPDKVSFHERVKKSAPTTCEMAPASTDQIVGLITLILLQWEEMMPLLDIAMVNLFHRKVYHDQLCPPGHRREQ